MTQVKNVIQHQENSNYADYLAISTENWSWEFCIEILNIRQTGNGFTRIG